MRSYISIVFIFCLSFGCSKKDSFQYEKGLSAYLYDTFSEKLKYKKDGTLYFLYLEYCRSCVFDALTFLDGIKNPGDNSKVYFIGEPNFYPEHQDIIKRLKRKYIFQTDENSHHYSYVTGIGEPLILGMKNGEIVFSSYINSETIDELYSRFSD